jgi:exopolysaccharide biosynthesis protein
MSTNQRFFTVLVAALGAACAAENAAARPETPTGIFYTNAVVAEVPWSVQIVKIERGRSRYEIQSRHAGGGALGLATLSDQVATADTDTSEPVAAINGGFFLRENGQTNAYAGCPRGLQIVAGEVLSAPSGNASMWVDYSGQPHAANVTSRFEITWPDGRVTAFELNGQRADGGVEIYTPAAGTSTHTTGGRELILESLTGGRWLPLRMERDYSTRLREIRRTGNMLLTPDTIVLSLGPAIMEQFQGVTTGAVVRISTKSLPDLLNAKTAISGGPLLVQNGKAQKIRSAPDDAYELSSMLERHPRTAFGWNDQSFFLVQVDGRQKDLSLGMTLDELSAYLVKLGCTDAMNLDGGGSSSLWFEGKVRNNPCDGYERSIANSLIVLRKKTSAAGINPPSTNAEALPERSRENGN